MRTFYSSVKEERTSFGRGTGIMINKAGRIIREIVLYNMGTMYMMFGSE
jgi:hypothetical protein